MNIQHALKKVNNIDKYQNSCPIKYEVFFYFVLLFSSKRYNMNKAITELNNSLLHYVDLSFLKHYTTNDTSQIFNELYSIYKEGKL